MEFIAPIIIFIGLSTVTGTQYLLPLGRQKEFTISVVIGSIVNFLLNMILIVYFKSIGAAIATLIAEITIMIIQMYYLRKEFNFKILFLQGLKYFIFGAVMFLVVKILTNYLPVSIISTFIEVIVGGLCIYYY